MKKVLIVLSISALFAACNSGSSTTEVKADSSTTVTTDTSKMAPAADTASKMMADTSKMTTDTTKMSKDTTKK